MLNFHQVLVKPHPTKALGGPLPQTKCANHVFPHLPTRIYATTSVIKKLQYNFPQMRGGGRGPFGIFQKIHPIWRSHPSLRYQVDSKKESRLPLPNIPSKFQNTSIEHAEFAKRSLIEKISIEFVKPRKVLPLTAPCAVSFTLAFFSASHFSVNRPHLLLFHHFLFFSFLSVLLLLFILI